MDLGLRDRVYIVTGGSRGLGFATARQLVDEGARVVISGLDETEVSRVATKLSTSNYEQIPISVGQFPRQLAVSRNTVYVTNYNSSNLFLIDAKTSEVIGEPVRIGVNPFSLAVSDDDKTLWVGNPPSDRVSEVATGRGG